MIYDDGWSLIVIDYLSDLCDLKRLIFLSLKWLMNLVKNNDKYISNMN